MRGSKDDGNGNVMLVIAVIIVIIVVFIFFGSKINATSGLHKKIFGDRLSNTASPLPETKALVLPPIENDWCKVQEIMVGGNREDPIRDIVAGWDNIEECCARKVTGFNCALKKEVTVEYCYTAHIGGEIKWVMNNGYYGDVELYKSYMEDLDKETIPNKICDAEKYPEWMVSG